MTTDTTKKKLPSIEELRGEQDPVLTLPSLEELRSDVKKKSPLS